MCVFGGGGETVPSYPMNAQLEFAMTEGQIKDLGSFSCSTSHTGGWFVFIHTKFASRTLRCNERIIVNHFILVLGFIYACMYVCMCVYR